ncbi:MAG: hypothetical protein H6981_12285 [Gammaproteobacteria bacterium]|nr:hypothetical protein [Gammaproteobacteria bacterium]MCP5137568.1 hypothetical protein [Gammaproteobacteria bacterium]
MYKLPLSILIVMLFGIAPSAHAVVFTVDSLASGAPGSALNDDVLATDPQTQNHLYFNDHNSSGNVGEMDASAIGIAASHNVNALSNGNDAIGIANRLYFSVTGSSMGEVGTALRAEADLGEQAGDIFGFGEGMGGFMTKIVDAVDLGLAANDNIDGADAFDPYQPNFTHFNDRVYFATDTAFGGFGTEDILFSDGAGNITLYADGVTVLGLAAGDVIDALVLDTTAGLAMFSLANGSTSLISGGFSGADLFSSSLNGSFALAVSHTELGLLATDDIDAIEVDFESVPVPGSAFLMLGALAGLRRYRNSRTMA